MAYKLQTPVKMNQPRLFAIFLSYFLSLNYLVAADDCQPVTWPSKRDGEKVGDVVCRYDATTPLEVNYYTCSALAIRYQIPVETFFMLNPQVDRDCKTIKPNTTYCVAGYLQPNVSTDGFCGPNHYNQVCGPTEKPCCNGETWKCGDTANDCAPGTCYEGRCRGFPSEYSMDGKCGPKNGWKKCGGKWGDCCNFDGQCGTGPSFCSQGKCESGNCTFPTTTTTLASLPWQTGTTPDGSCGRSNGFTCDIVFGKCCGAAGQCGSLMEHCGPGCQPGFGLCNDNSTTTSTSASKPTTSSTSTTSVTPTKSTSSSTSSSTQTPVTSGSPSPDGTCGGSKGYTCKGTSYGNCCSAKGYCGNSADYCAQGCQSKFSSGCITSNIPSLDGSCGKTQGGYTCAGGPFDGQCCSASGFCGKTSDYCGSGCQTGYGKCGSS